MKKSFCVYATLVIFLLLLVLAGCGKKGGEQADQTATPASLETQEAAAGGGQPAAAEDVQKDFTFIFYADTRGDPRGVNWFQSLHKKFIAKLLDNEKDNHIHHLVFGGDNVLIGFLKPSWNRFFEVMKAYEEKQITVYPALGNHELWLSRWGLAMLKLHRKKVADKIQDNEIAEMLDILYEKKNEQEELVKLLADKTFREKLTAALQTEMNDPSFAKEEQEFIKQLENDFGEVKAPIFDEIQEIYAIAQEMSLYDILENEVLANKPSTNWKRFKWYVDAWPYLANIEKIKEEKTYYSFVLPDEQNPKIKIIILDSNKSMINDAAQKEWFEKELNFDGPVMAACHHPVFCGSEYPDGWFFKEYAAGWKKPPHLFMVGHVHDYERVSQAKEGNTCPVYIISGSGGAYLTPANKVPRCKSDTTWVSKSAFNYTQITVTADSLKLKVFAFQKVEEPFTLIDELEFKWKQPLTL